MSLTHALLGLLAERSLTGYELKTVWFDRTIAHFWAADQAQIYRTLERLTAQELVRVEAVFSPNRLPRKRYSLTAAGRAELASWLRTPQPSAPVRDALQIQLFCGASLTDEELTALLTAERSAQERRRDLYRQQFAAAEAGSDDRAHRLRLLTLRRGIERAAATIAWVEEALATVADLPSAPQRAL